MRNTAMSELDFIAVDLKHARDTLVEAVQVFNAAVVEEKGAFFLPDAFDDEEDPHALIARAITDMDNGKTSRAELPPSGVLCATPALMLDAERLNLAKQHFKTVAVWFAKNLPASEFKEILRYTGVNLIDRNAAYCAVPFLPASTVSVVWFWAKKHRAIKSISHQDAVTLTEKLSTEKSQIYARELLAQCPSTDRLAIARPKPIQLRANIKFYDDAVEINHSMTTPRVMLIPNTKLPQTVMWNESDDQRTRKQRTDVRIEALPLISGLNLYRYTTPARGRSPHA